eukprot:scaffold4440_cov16-Tisochrysis_lutea.AAC.1
MPDKACIPECWKAAKITPLHEKGHVLDSGNYCMLTVSGTMYRLNDNVLHEVVADWCKFKNKLPNSQFGFHPGWSTLQPIFLLRHLRHAVQCICMLAHILAVIKNLYEDDEYVLVDRLKHAA